jgi:ribokinase
MRVLNIGSLNIDYVYDVEHFVRPGETIASTSRSVFPGGKGLNQSIALARAGAEVWHVGVVGREGVWLKSLLKDSGVWVRFVEEQGETASGHAIIQRDSSGGNCIILYGGTNQLLAEEQIDTALSAAEPGDWLLLQNETSGVGHAIVSAKNRGMSVALNPSPANGLLDSYPLDLVDLFLLNEIEAATILGGGRASNRELIEAMQQMFPNSSIVLTIGDSGSLFSSKDTGVIVQKAYHADVVDTTAAGDTFTGYFLASIMNGEDVSIALDRASMASSVAVSRLGAAPSIPHAEEVNDYLARKRESA